jgi:hypothetical protein
LAALRQRVMALCPQVVFISAGEFKEKSRAQISSSGYVIHTLEAALWAQVHGLRGNPYRTALQPAICTPRIVRIGRVVRPTT